MVFLELVGDLFLVHVGADIALQRLHDVDQRHGPVAAHQHGERDHPAHLHAGIDDADLVELFRQPVALGAGMVDGLAHRPEFRRREHLALHEAAGGLFLEGEAMFERGAVLRGDLRQDLVAAFLVQVFQDGRRIVGIEQVERFSDDLVGQDLDGALAILVAQLDQDLARQRPAEQAHAIKKGVGGELFERIGRIGRVQPEQGARQPRLVMLVDGIDKIVQQDRIEARIFVRRGVFRRLIHRALFPRIQGPRKALVHGRRANSPQKTRGAMR